MSFLGPKPTQDPMNIVFEQKNSWGKFFSGPPGPPTEKIFGPGPAGSPKVVKIVLLGSLTLLKRSGTPMVHGKGGVDRPVTPPLAKVMTKTRFFGIFLRVLGRFQSRLGPRLCSRPQNQQKQPKIENPIKKIVTRVLTIKFFAGFSSTLKGLV